MLPQSKSGVVAMLYRDPNVNSSLLDFRIFFNFFKNILKGFQNLRLAYIWEPVSEVYVFSSIFQHQKFVSPIVFVLISCRPSWI